MRTPCVNCPAIRASVFSDALRGERDCVFRRASLGPREALPPDWAEEHAFLLVERGVIVVEGWLENGHPVATDVVGPGGMVLLTPRETFGHAASETRVCLMPRATKEHLGVDGWRDIAMLEGTAIQRLHRLTLARSQRTARAKVLALLRVLGETLYADEPRAWLISSLQQGDLAELVGLRRETVCRAFAQLEKEGIVVRTADGCEFR